MPVDTSGIQTIIQAFLQGQQLAEGARQNVLRAEQFKVAQESEAEDRKIRLKALEDQIKRNAERHELDLESVRLARKTYEMNAVDKFNDDYSAGRRKLPNSQMHEEVTRHLIPNFLAHPSLLPNEEQIIDSQTLFSNAINPQNQVEAPPPIETETSQMVPNEMVTIPGTDIQIPSSSLVGPENNPELQYKLAKERGDIENEIENRKLRKLQIDTISEDKEAARKVQSDIAKGHDQTRRDITAAMIAARKDLVTMMQGEKDNKKKLAMQNAVDGVAKHYMMNPTFQKYPQIVTDSNLLAKAAANPESITPIEQTRLLSLLPRYDDLRSSVREPEVQRAIDSLVTLYAGLGLKAERILGGTQRIPPAAIKQAGIIYGGILKPYSDNFTSVRDSYVQMLKEHEVPDEKIDTLLPDLRAKEYERQVQSATPQIDWSKVKGIKK